MVKLPKGTLVQVCTFLVLLLPRTPAAAGAGPNSLAGVFQRISAEVCENASDMSITP
jgi:hypothetical protein